MVSENRNIALIIKQCPFCGHHRAFSKGGLNVKGIFCTRCKRENPVPEKK